MKILLGLVALVLLYLGGVILYGTITDYQPAEVLPVPVENNPSAMISDSVFTFMIWNIGYSGLGKDADFFYDGGKMMRSSEDKVSQYLKEIKSFLKSHDSIDFILLQEVDMNAYRSYEINEVDTIAQLLRGDHGYAFAANYKAPFVPLPLTQPMRQVYGGLLSLFKYNTSKATRQGFVKENFSWPKKVFFLDRCMLENRFNLANGKQLVVYNTHKSAYDETGKLKMAEMTRMKTLIDAEYAKGNYVVVGGDWNQLPPGFDDRVFNSDKSKTPPQGISNDFLETYWKWVYDTRTPTNRDLSATYEKGKTYTTLIDYFLMSDNLDLIKVKTADLGFACSDHQPVMIQVALKR